MPDFSSNGHASTITSDEPDFVETHYRQRTHVIFPQDVWNMALREELSMMHLELLNVIDSLVNRKGIGCWATNKWLGRQINRSPGYVSGMIKKLKSLGLLKCVGWIILRDNKYRILETIWSRVIEKGKDRTPQASEMESAFDESYGKVQVHLFPPERLEARRDRGVYRKIGIRGGIPKNRKDIPDLYSHTTYENIHQKEEVPASSITPDSLSVGNGKVTVTKGHAVRITGLFAKSNIKDKPPVKQLTWVRSIRAAIRECKRKPEGKESTGAWQLVDLINELGDGDDRVGKIVAGFAKSAVSIGKEPRINSVKQFCERFNWVEDRVKELNPELFDKEDEGTMVNINMTQLVYEIEDGEISSQEKK